MEAYQDIIKIELLFDLSQNRILPKEYNGISILNTDTFTIKKTIENCDLGSTINAFELNNGIIYKQDEKGIFYYNVYTNSQNIPKLYDKSVKIDTINF